MSNIYRDKKIAVLGTTSYQAELMERAKSLGIEVHAFAWAADDVGEKVADYFYPISIVEKDEILKKCQEIGIDGITSVACDIAMPTVSYAADKLGLIHNTLHCTEISTHKGKMREAFRSNNDPSPLSVTVDDSHPLEMENPVFPLIVKPTDRSGSRGITKVYKESELSKAIKIAINESYDKRAVVEEYAEGQEYSVEYVSWEGKHNFLALTKKYTTGSPHYIETGHRQPSGVDEKTLERVKKVISHALDSLEIKYGASHSEIKIDDEGNIKIIEIGGRMGGDHIGTKLVEMSTGIDFLKAVIDVALGYEPDVTPKHRTMAAGVRFIVNKEDRELLADIQKTNPGVLTHVEVWDDSLAEITNSTDRHGLFVMQAENSEELDKYFEGLE